VEVLPVGRGVYVDSAVRHFIDVVRAARDPESAVMDALLLKGLVVDEMTYVAGIEVKISLMPPDGPWARLLIGRFSLSCELLQVGQLADLRSTHREVDDRGVVPNPAAWRCGTAAAPAWNLWNVRVREMKPFGRHFMTT